MLINQLRDEIHDNAKLHGWWDSPRSFGDIIALCHSELSEALEEYRTNPDNVFYFEDGSNKPEGIAVELADTIIRILDYCGHAKIDIGYVLRKKHDYNYSRPYRHGGKSL